MDVKGNIWKMYVIKACFWFLVMIAIIIPFFEENNLTMFQIMLLQAAFGFCVTIFEIPSGYFADVYGRKNSMIVGLILAAIGTGVMSFSHTFWGFFVGEVIMGLGYSFVSGSDSALLYDTLVQTNQTKEYTKIEGRSYGIGNFSEAIAGVLGGGLALLSLRTPFYFRVLILLVAVYFAFLLVEPIRAKKVNANGTIANFKHIFKHIVTDRPKLGWWIVVSSFIACSSLIIAWMTQKLFGINNLGLFWYGILWGVLNLWVGIVSWNAAQIEKRFSQFGVVVLVCVFILLGYFGMVAYPTLFAVGFVMLIYVGRGLATPIFRNYINELTDSDIRATVLSIRSLLMRILFVVLGPLTGWVYDNYSFSHAIAASGLILLLGTVISTIVLIRKQGFSTFKMLEKTD